MFKRKAAENQAGEQLQSQFEFPLYYSAPLALGKLLNFSAAVGPSLKKNSNYSSAVL